MRWVALILAVVAIVSGGSDARAGCSPTLEWQGAGPRWSPDGSRLAFYRVLPGGNPAPVAVYVVPVEGGTPRRESGATNGQWPPSWSADGRLLAVGGWRGIEVVDADRGRRPVEVTRGLDYAPSWSPGWRDIVDCGLRLGSREGACSRSAGRRSKPLLVDIALAICARCARATYAGRLVERAAHRDLAERREQFQVEHHVP